jgi:pimeloyl-ACP methyl ester carboxylesterase
MASTALNIARTVAFGGPTEKCFELRRLGAVSGYYYPTVRLDVAAMSAPAIPIVGDIMGYTVSPMVSRLIWPLMMAKIFGPKRAPAKFQQFPKEMALRPSQIRASAAESALMIPDAVHFEDKYADLKMPVVIIAGEDDRLIDIDKQSARLHSDVPQSRFHRVSGNGHMIQQTATDKVMAAIEEVVALSSKVEKTELAPAESIERELSQDEIVMRAQEIRRL